MRWRVPKQPEWPRGAGDVDEEGSGSQEQQPDPDPDQARWNVKAFLEDQSGDRK